MFIKLIMMANWKDDYTVMNDRKIPIYRGQLATTTRELAGLLGCCRQTLFTFLKILESTGMIRRETYCSKFTIITIENYDSFQPNNESEEAQINMDSFPSAEETVSVEDNENTRNEQKIAVENALKNDENNVENPVSLDRKLDHIIINNNINNITSSTRTHACAREENIKIFRRVTGTEMFWPDLAQGLGLDKKLPDTIPKLKELAEMYLGEQLSKGKKILDEKKMLEHIFNWIRKSIEKNKGKFTNINTGPNITRHGSTQIDRRRSVDAAPPRKSELPKGRF